MSSKPTCKTCWFRVPDASKWLHNDKRNLPAKEWCTLECKELPSKPCGSWMSANGARPNIEMSVKIPKRETDEEKKARKKAKRLARKARKEIGNGE